MCDASWINSFFLCRLAFIIVAHNNCIILAGAMPSTEESNLYIKLAALEEALHHYKNKSLNPNHIFCDSHEMLELMYCHDSNLM